MKEAARHQDAMGKRAHVRHGHRKTQIKVSYCPNAHHYARKLTALLSPISASPYIKTQGAKNAVSADIPNRAGGESGIACVGSLEV